MTRQRRERILPWLALASLQHCVDFLAGLLATEDGASLQLTFMAGHIAQRTLELKLQNPGEKIAGVGDISGNVVFRARIEVLLGALERRGGALVLGS